ncbi:DUF63 family protein [Candidatus Micrarchaeota archaeon]|nr:DUF63 family protein [Candidatus Micrarchaeota archaeon]
MENFIYDYFIEPIWSHTGYNVVNTLVYAAVAIAAVYAIYRAIGGKIKIDEHFIRSVLCFVLLGSTLRVVTDSIDTGAMKPVTPVHQFVLDSHIFDYPQEDAANILQYWTVTPGIYIAVAALLLVSLVILYKIKRVEWLGYVGLAFWIPCFLLLLPFMNYWIYAIPVLLMAAIPAYVALRYFKDRIMAGIVAGHALDGAATFFAIEVFPLFTGISYSEQHVFSGAIGILSGNFLAFYFIKVAIAFGAAYLLTKEKMTGDERNYIALVLMIIGFAPGLRDVLRMVVGA